MNPSVQRVYTAAVLGLIVLASGLVVGGCGIISRSRGSSGLPGGELETRVVRVHAYAGAEPLHFFIRPGTVVVWLNQYADDIRIMFPDRVVTISCLNPVNFTLTPEGFFESGYLPHGAVASLCFLQPGSYDYSVERQPATGRARSEGFRLEGVITVR